MAALAGVWGPLVAAAGLSGVGAGGAHAVAGGDALAEEVQLLLVVFPIEKIKQHGPGNRSDGRAGEELGDERADLDGSTVGIDLARHANSAADALGQVDVGAGAHLVVDVGVFDFGSQDAGLAEGVANELADIVLDTLSGTIHVAGTEVGRLIPGGRQNGDVLAEVRAAIGFWHAAAVVHGVVGVEWFFADKVAVAVAAELAVLVGCAVSA